MANSWRGGKGLCVSSFPALLVAAKLLFLHPGSIQHTAARCGHACAASADAAAFGRIQEGTKATRAVPARLLCLQIDQQRAPVSAKPRGPAREQHESL